LNKSDKVAELTKRDACASSEHCIRACKRGAIHMARVPWTGNTSRGLWHTHRSGPLQSYGIHRVTQVTECHPDIS
jgi:Na+-translocating ferredoxin:NAD+ oxidoreductase RNF subunit RnfB